MRLPATLLFVTALASMARAELPTPEALELAMLGNIKEHGFNPDPRINEGLGGLWINWRTGPRPLLVNFNGSGEPDGAKVDPPRHDDLTDLRYLHNLFNWKHQHPADTSFDDEIKRYDAIVKHELRNARNERGWIYDELIHMARLSGDAFFRDTARRQAEYFATKQYREDVGCVFKTSKDDKAGHYRVDLALEIGCALVQAGWEFQQPDWSAKGGRIVSFVYDHAYLAEHHLFLAQMAGVLLPDGTANPNEPIYRAKVKHYLTNGGNVRFGGVGQTALSLLHCYIVTKDPVWLDRANDLLEPLTADKNSLGLWDKEHGGYFTGVEFSGPDFQKPGKPRLLDKSKECGRQFHMLQAFHVASQFTGGKYRPMVDAMRRVLLEKAWFAPGQGVFYECEPDWSPRKAKSGAVCDWVTTEAMGCSMMALFALTDPDPW